MRREKSAKISSERRASLQGALKSKPLFTREELLYDEPMEPIRISNTRGFFETLMGDRCYRALRRALSRIKAFIKTSFSGDA